MTEFGGRSKNFALWTKFWQGANAQLLFCARLSRTDYENMKWFALRGWCERRVFYSNPVAQVAKRRCAIFLTYSCIATVFLKEHSPVKPVSPI